jgi:hypothetical protein
MTACVRVNRRRASACQHEAANALVNVGQQTEAARPSYSMAPDAGFPLQGTPTPGAYRVPLSYRISFSATVHVFAPHRYEKESLSCQRPLPNAKPKRKP